MRMKNVLIAVAAFVVGAAGIAAELVPGATIHGFSVRSVTDLPEVRGRLVRMTCASGRALPSRRRFATTSPPR